MVLLVSIVVVNVILLSFYKSNNKDEKNYLTDYKYSKKNILDYEQQRRKQLK
jgi:hypothetical protein